MNAYELADWMENAIISDDWGELAKYYGWCNEHIPTMLRQQADRIAELEKELQRLVANAEFELDRAFWKIKELQKSSEPVAWIKQSKYGLPALVWHGEPIKYNATSVKQNDIPLYTTPQTKPLSDEEIPVLTILHNAQSVPLGDAIYETDKEYEKLKKIVIASIKWAIEERILEK